MSGVAPEETEYLSARTTSSSVDAIELAKRSPSQQIEDAVVSLDKFLSGMDAGLQGAAMKWVSNFVEGVADYAVACKFDGSTLDLRLKTPLVAEIATRSRVPVVYELDNTVSLAPSVLDQGKCLTFTVRGLCVGPVDGASEAYNKLRDVWAQQGLTSDDVSGRAAAAWAWWKATGAATFEGRKLWRLVESLAGTRGSSMIPQHGFHDLLMGAVCVTRTIPDQMTFSYYQRAGLSRGPSRLLRRSSSRARVSRDKGRPNIAVRPVSRPSTGSITAEVCLDSESGNESANSDSDVADAPAAASVPVDEPLGTQGKPASANVPGQTSNASHSSIHDREAEAASRNERLQVVCTTVADPATLDSASELYDADQLWKSQTARAIGARTQADATGRALAERFARSAINFSCLFGNTAELGVRGAHPDAVAKLFEVSTVVGGATWADRMIGACHWQKDDETFKMTGDAGRIRWTPAKPRSLSSMAA